MDTALVKMVWHLSAAGRKENVMDLPMDLKTATEKLVVGYKQAQLKKIAQELSERYRNESGAGKVLLSKDIEAAVYAIVRMPATYGAVSDALTYALEYFDGDMKSLLDVGAGSAAASWAVSEQISLENITCIEREGAMRRVGEALMKEGGSALASAKWISADLTSLKMKTKADLVVSSYVLNEMTKKDREYVVDCIWQATEKMLLIVEPGTPAGYRNLRDVREYLLQKGAHVAAPCPHEGPCRIDENDWCHFTCRIQRSKFHKILKDADVPYEDEKYTYVAFVRNECSHCKARILRHPYIDKGRVDLEVCTAQDNRRIAVKKKDGNLFKTARKAKHGDSIDII